MEDHELLREVQVEQQKNKLQTGYDPEPMPIMLKQEEKLRIIRQVKSSLVGFFFYLCSGPICKIGDLISSPFLAKKKSKALLELATTLKL
jgi:hypothetical protein